MFARMPFARRIVLGFVFMAMVVSGSFAIGIVATVHFVERHLVSSELGRELDGVLLEDLESGHPPRLDSHTRFFVAGPSEYPVPARFAGFPEGFTEVVDDDRAFYVFAREINGVRYFLVQEQSEFEAREQVLFNVVLAGFLLSVLLAWGLGRFMAGHVMAPVSRLADRVRRTERTEEPVALEPSRYADDEVGELAVALDSAFDGLRLALERERLFTGDVSHELRTPLMVIASSCELLRETSLTPVQQGQLERIQRAGAEMQDLVQTFLFLARSRSEEGGDGVRITLAQAAREQGERWGDRIREKGVSFEVYEEEVDTGEYSGVFLGAVLSNLLRNALHHTVQGEIRLVLEQGGVRVEDTGTGIPEDERERVFEPYVRGVGARGDGVGLGLSLVKRICAHQGWKVFVTPLNPGICFSVVLCE